jgi:HK97 family phage portal protein
MTTPSFIQKSISVGNQVYQILFTGLSRGMKLSKDTDLKKLIETSDTNTSVFGITMRLCFMFAQIPINWYKGEVESETSKEIPSPLIEIFKDRSSDYTEFEFRMMWELSGLLAGESISYVPKRKTGMTREKGYPLTFEIMPPQNVEIESNGWREPVGKYKLDLDDGHEIDPNEVWHTRFFPNISFEDGKNFRGRSPLSVARKLIEAEVNSDDLVSQMYESGLPPGILSEENAQKPTGLQQNKLINIWRKKYRNRKKKNEPIVTQGKITWTPIGFSNLKDLQVVELSTVGLKKLCNVWAVPDRAFNSESGDNLNKKEDQKAIYTNRLIPDMTLYIEGLNRIFNKVGIWCEADYSDIGALNEDRKDIIQRLTLGFDRGIVKVNEWRIAAGMEELSDDEIEELLLSMQERKGQPMVPMSEEEQQKQKQYLGYE